MKYETSSQVKMNEAVTDFEPKTEKFYKFRD